MRIDYEERKDSDTDDKKVSDGGEEERIPFMYARRYTSFSSKGHILIYIKVGIMHEV